MKIGVIGTGNIGGTLARHLSRLGHDVVVANSRGSSSLAVFANEIGAKAASVQDAARAGEVVILSVRGPAVGGNSPRACPNVPRQRVRSTQANYYTWASRQADRGDRPRHVRQPVGRAATGPPRRQGLQVTSRRTASAKRDFMNGALEDRSLSRGDPAEARATVLRPYRRSRIRCRRCRYPSDRGGSSPEPRLTAKILDAAGLKEALAQADPNRIAEYRAHAIEFGESLLRQPLSPATSRSILENPSPGMAKAPTLALADAAAGPGLARHRHPRATLRQSHLAVRQRVP